MPPRLLITGSREADYAMLKTAHDAIVRARALEWTVVVGDAQGIDQAVVRACCQQFVHFQCFGITDRPRNIDPNDDITCNWRFLGTYTKVNGNFLSRDRHMVLVADRILAIWNGTSSGTRYTFEYAQKLGKHVDVMDFSKEQVKR